MVESKSCNDWLSAPQTCRVLHGTEPVIGPCAMTGSVVVSATQTCCCKMAEALQSYSALVRNRTQVAKLTATHLNH